MFQPFLFSTKNQKPSQLFTYEILENRLNQKKFSYRIYFSIFVLRCDVSKSITNYIRKMKKQPLLTNFTLAILMITKADHTPSIFLFFSSNDKLVADIKSCLQNKGQQKDKSTSHKFIDFPARQWFWKNFFLICCFCFYVVLNGSYHVIIKFTSSTTITLKILVLSNIIRVYHIVFCAGLGTHLDIKKIRSFSSYLCLL